MDNEDYLDVIRKEISGSADRSMLLLDKLKMRMGLARQEKNISGEDIRRALETYASFVRCEAYIDLYNRMGGDKSFLVDDRVIPNAVKALESTLSEVIDKLIEDNRDKE